MKKFLIFMLITLFAGFVVHSAKTAPPTAKAEYIVATPDDCPASFVASVSPRQDVPSTAPGDILDLPGKGAGWGGWLDWILAAAAFIVYEVMVRVKPTSKTYSILGLLYTALNWIKPDKTKQGEKFKIKPG